MVFIKQHNPCLNMRLILLAQSSLFKNISSSIVFLVFKHFYPSLFWLDNDASLNVQTLS